jgi:hypothetical protein
MYHPTFPWRFKASKWSKSLGIVLSSRSASKRPLVSKPAQQQPSVAPPLQSQSVGTPVHRTPRSTFLEGSNEYTPSQKHVFLDRSQLAPPQKHGFVGRPAGSASTQQPTFSRASHFIPLQRPASVASASPTCCWICKSVLFLFQCVVKPAAFSSGLLS